MVLCVDNTHRSRPTGLHRVTTPPRFHALPGRAAKHAASKEERTAIARLFWFTMEVGVVLEEGRPRACGAAILSSVTEMESFVDAELRDFRVEEVIAHEIDDRICQPVLFVADSVSQMMADVRRFIGTHVGS